MSAADHRPAPILRPACLADCDAVFAWVNDPETRAASCSQDPVPYEDHQLWFEVSLLSDRRSLFVAELAGEPCAFLRLDRPGPDADSAEVSINVAPESRGRGLGLALLHALEREAQRQGLRRLDAHIRPDNRVSRRAFERVGYRLEGTATVRGAEVERWSLSLV